MSSWAQVPKSSHVFVVMEENHGYSSVIGSSSMPYLNSLADRYGLATQYYGNVHPSMGNYFMLTTGQIISTSDSYSGTVSSDNIVRELNRAGKSWRVYAESIPSVGYIGGDSGAYLRHHNPFSYFSDVKGSTSQRNNIVPATRMTSDLNSGSFANFNFIIPNVNDDAHNGSLGQADAWLQQHIDPIINSSEFQKDGLMIILFDEASTSDTSHGGGHVAAVVIGPAVKSGHRAATVYQHQSTLRLVLNALGVGVLPGASANAPSMAQFFGGSAQGPSGCSANINSVRICSPSSGATVTSPVNIVAAGDSSAKATAIQLYDNGRLVYQVAGSTINHAFTFTPGYHNITVKLWTVQGANYMTNDTIDVR